MANYSKFLSLISGVDRTVDLSLASNVLELGGGGLQMDGSTSGHVVISASATTTTYSIIWPAAQAASTGYVLTNDGTGVLSWSPAAATGVTSVAFADDSTTPIYSVSGSPVTSSGTLAITLATQSANTVFAGPASGSAAQPTFRTLVSADIPNNTANTTGTASNITATTNATLTTLSALTTAGSLAISGSQVSGGTFGAVNGSALTNLSAANLSGILPVGVTGGSGLSIATSQLTGTVSLTTQVSGILPVANGGTGDSSFTAYSVILGGTTSTAPLQNVSGLGTTGQVLTSAGAGAAPTWTTASSGSVTSVAFADDSTTPIYSVSGSPVTSSGTLAITLATQTANTVFAGPSSGSAAQPTFRSLVIADLSFASAANGVATLDGGGKVPLSQLPSTLMEFQGNWNPNTNTPTLVDGTGTTGFTYWVSAADTGTVAGLTDPSMVNFQVGDLVIYNGTKWVLTTPAAGVSFVNGAQGSVVLSMASANGFAGTYSGTALTVSTTLTTPVVAANGTALIAATTTGTGSTVVLATSPVLVTPNLGTPSTLVLTNATGLPLTTGVTGTLPIANGGTNATTATAAYNNLSPMTTTGDIEYESATNTASRLPIGTAGQVLTVVAGIPAWANPEVQQTVIAGQAFSANTTYALRWGQPSQSETTNRVYAADMSTSVTDRFWVIGAFNSTSSTSIGGTITMTTSGPLTLASGDTNFASGDQGYPVWLASAGAYAGNAAGESPGAGNASSKIGIAESATVIWVSPQMMGVN